MTVTVECDMFGKLKPQQVNGKQAELADLLSAGPTSAPTAEQLQAALATLPTSEGLARLLQARWSRQTYVAGHQEILDAFSKLFENEASSNLKVPAKAFLDDLVVRIKDLIVQSTTKFGQTEGELYDEVFGEGSDKSVVPGYLPAVSHYQLYYHELGNSKEIFKSWTVCLSACGIHLGIDGLGSSPERRAFMYLLSLAQDISYVRLCQALLTRAVTFKYA